MSKLIYLTKVGMRPNERGEKRIESALEKEKLQGSSDGMPLSFYLENNLRPPDDIEDEGEIDSGGNIKLLPEEMEEFYSDMVLSLDDFSMAIDDEEDGSKVFTKHGSFINVAENSWEVSFQIEEFNKTWWEKLKDRIQTIIHKFKSKRKAK